jgi:hypothetical protein
MVQKHFRNTILGLALLTSLTNASCFYQGSYHKEVTGFLALITLVTVGLIKPDPTLRKEEKTILKAGKILAVIVAVFCAVYATMIES